MDVFALLERSYDATGRIVTGTKPGQLTIPTPCTEWNVQALLNHIVGVTQVFAKAAATGAVSGPPDNAVDVLGGDPWTAYEQSAKTTLEAWRAPGLLERTFTLPFGDVPGSVALNVALTDNFVHGWDLAKATGQSIALDPAIAEVAYGFVSQIPEPMRAGLFAPPVSVPASAPIGDRLIGLVGRTP